MEVHSKMAKRPIGVWIIVGFYSLAFCLAVPSTIYTINNHPEVFSRFSNLEITLTFFAMVMTFIAVVFLFRLRAVSFWIFLGIAVVSFVPLIIRMLSGQKIPIPENTGYGGKIFEVIIWGAVMLYIWALKSKGILK